MRQITRHAISAFLYGYNFNRANTTVKNGVMRLHGHVIARNTARYIEISDGGYQTNTTKDKLNGIISSVIGPRHKIYQKDFVWYFNDRDGNPIRFDEAKDSEGFVSLAEIEGSAK